MTPAISRLLASNQSSFALRSVPAPAPAASLATNIDLRGPGPSLAPLLAAPTLAAVLAFAAQRDTLIRALTPDALKGAAAPNATAATINSAPYPSGQNSAYANGNGAFREAATTPARTATA